MRNRAAGWRGRAAARYHRNRVHFHPHRARAARRVRDLAVHHRDPRTAGLDLTIDPIPSGECDHRYQAPGHDPGVKLRHLTKIRHATCTGPMCERPSGRADFEHNIPYEKGGRTCLCNTGPKCRHEHRLKQDPRWKVEQHPDGTFTWTTPSGRQYTTQPTEYPI
jgi:hypothetical protein